MKNHPVIERHPRLRIPLGHAAGDMDRWIDYVGERLSVLNAGSDRRAPVTTSVMSQSSQINNTPPSQIRYVTVT